MKRGGPLRRRTPLKRSGPLARSPMRTKYSLKGKLATLGEPIAKALGIETMAERRQRRKRERYLGGFAGPFPGYDHSEFCRRRGCLLALLTPSYHDHRCEGPVQAAHVIPRSRGGSWKDVVGLCLLAHQEFDVNMANSPSQFLDRHGVDLSREAWAMALGAPMRAAQDPGRWDTDMRRRMTR